MSAPSLENTKSPEPWPQPEVIPGPTFHSCEFCKEFEIKFDLSDGDIKKIVRSFIQDERERKNCATIVRTWITDAPSLEARTILGFTLVDARKFHYVHNLQAAISQVNISVDDFSSAEWNHVQSPLTRHTLNVPADSPLAGVITERPMNFQIWSDRAQEQVKQWMKTCFGTHEACRLNQKAFSPSCFLIETLPSQSEPSGITLHLTEDVKQSAAYAALSYCW
ncbi:hypothetical protein BU23DRAFT_602761 [Bimuria novae-zelandiae CBS 107.79]|uniref:Uncharacterized protein n=1 Tax=Bimuria novae-zelandiae CBS 107.79 TaxID=1447943 RepID=A0A6A5URJ2_9PLEO|nr:hypothetical protein BU23DRAFT_602761 [Bimuria novae-zelandiae CBS 107.79]